MQLEKLGVVAIAGRTPQPALRRFPLVLALALSWVGCAGDDAVGPTSPEPVSECRVSNDGFEPELALELEKLVAIATQDFREQQPGERLRESCWELVRYVESPSTVLPNTQMMVAKNTATGDLGVAFPGSDGFQDWLLNLTAVAADWVLDGSCDTPNQTETVPDGVHAGFLLDYSSVKDELRDLLLANMPAAGNRATARVFFSGHSLGGALATLASLDLVNELVRQGYARNNVVMYSIAAPRAMKQDLKSKYTCLVPNSYALAHLSDPVPRFDLPGYTHIKNMVVLIAKEEPLLSPKAARVLRMAGSQFPSQALGSCDVAVDPAYHGRALYKNRLAVIEPGQIPNLKIRVTAGLLEIGAWNGIPEKCESIVVFRGTPGELDNAVLTSLRLVSTLTNGQYATTTIPRYAGYHVAYLDPTGRVIDSKEYEPATPSMKLTTPTVFHRVEWSVPDPGSEDFIAFYDHKPSNGDPDNFIPGSKILVFPFGQGGAVTSGVVGSGKWAAYVMKDARIGIGRSKILNEKKVP